jgi:hypothetical protein
VDAEEVFPDVTYNRMRTIAWRMASDGSWHSMRKAAKREREIYFEGIAN